MTSSSSPPRKMPLATSMKRPFKRITPQSTAKRPAAKVVLSAFLDKTFELPVTDVTKNGKGACKHVRMRACVCVTM